MGGKNLFEEYRRSEKSATFGLSQDYCVFISHRSSDKPMARATANALMEMNIDVYFDEEDADLQQASKMGDDGKIVECINKGLSKCTHLLGIITERTFTSWWVPYEIGSANGRNKECAHLLHKNVTELPSYVKVAPVLIDFIDLKNWLRSKLATKVLITEHEDRVAKEQTALFLENSRVESSIKFF